jgi:hypothetical protein
LRWQGEIELLHKDLLVGGQLGVTAKDQCSTIGGGEVNIEHLHGGHIVQYGPWREPARQRLEPRTQRHLQAIGHEGDKDVRLNAIFQPVIDRSQSEVVLEVLECGLDLNKLDVLIRS